MFQWFNKLSPEAQGNIILLVGVLLLLNALDLVQLNIVVIIAAGLMVYGFVQAGYWQLIKNFLQKHSHQK